jgi:tRNA (cytosine49-C5)-methyltransferase
LERKLKPVNVKMNRNKSIKNLKPLFKERMKLLLPEEKDYKNFLKILEKNPVNSIRCNTLKISPEKLKQNLEKKNWKIYQPWKSNPEVMIIKSELQPGEIGRSLEHLLGHYYVQELASMLPLIALDPKPNEIIIDLCAAPGSKTTQAAARMENKGTIIANEVSIGRLKILATNTERCGVTNTIITKKEGAAFLKEINIKFDKILIDAPCSGEGTLRSNPKTAIMWNPKTIKKLSKLQKRLVKESINNLKEKGELVYSTCTHTPEENEEIVDFLLNEFKGKIEIQEIKLPIKTRQGITNWMGKNYNENVKFSCRVYPQDNNTEGFFIAKFRKIKNEF